MPVDTKAQLRHQSKHKDDVAALLTVKKGSRFIPIALLVASVVAFVVHGLSAVGSHEALDDVFRQACSTVRATAEIANGTSSTTVDPAAMAEAKEQLAKTSDGSERDWAKTPIAARCAFGNDSIDALVAEFRKTNLVTSNELQSFTPAEIGGSQGVGIVMAASVKQYFDAIWTAALEYWWAVVVTVVSTAAYALVPGLAGLIYRRAFWSWFGVGFAIILAVSAVAASLSRLFETSAARDPVVETAAGVSVLLLVQVAILLFAFRVRRQTSRPPLLASLISARVINRGLFLLLVVVAVSTVIDVFGSKAVWNRLWTALPFNDTVEWLNVLLLGLPFVYALLKVTDTWSGRERKNIVVCLDGTSNTPDQYDMGFLSQTNVFKLFKMLKSDSRGSFVPTGRFDATLCKIYGERQIGFYYSGVGNKFDTDPVLGTLAQASGMGASGIIERAYLDVMRVWRPGDRLFIVGFSRGAASARLLARAIDERGAPRSVWTLRLLGRHWSLFPSGKQMVPITVLGCWDTVGSFGLAKTIAGINFQQLNLLHDMSIPETVEQAYHMVALDEERKEFAPTLMEPDPIQPDRIVEVWFPGTHAGVGGGFATDRLSDVPLDFLLSRVSSGYSADGVSEPGDESWGLCLAAVNGNPTELTEAREAVAGTAARVASEPDNVEAKHAADTAVARLDAILARLAQQGDTEGVIRIYPDPRGQLRVWISKLYEYVPRELPLHAHVSDAVFERMRTSEPIYAPQALFDLNDALDAKRDLITAKLDKLDETNSLSRAEREAMLTYVGKLKLMRWPRRSTPEQAAETALRLANEGGAASA